MIQVTSHVPGVPHLHDQGFMSIGLRPVFSDLMNGATDPYGNPLSFTRQYKSYLGGIPNAVLDPHLQKAIDGAYAPIGGAVLDPTFPLLGVDSATKSPILRNVALTPPYFSWGGYPSLRQVFKVYNRGMNRRDISPANGFVDRIPGTSCISGDDTGSGPDGNQPYPLTGQLDCASNTTEVIQVLGLSDCEAPLGSLPRQACIGKGHTVANDDLAALERFLKALTDYRVQCDIAPFDHPQLKIFNGHLPSDANGDGKADDIAFPLPEVGATGYFADSGYCIPNAGDLFAPGMQGRSGGPRVPVY
jgi:hypothetical protein